MTKRITAVEVILGIALVAMCALMFICYSQKKDLEVQVKQETIQNVQLTNKIREVKADSFRAGLITCGNEDVEWLNERADYYNAISSNNPLSKLMKDWAQTWTYDDATLNSMTEAYMAEGTE